MEAGAVGASLLPRRALLWLGRDVRLPVLEAVRKSLKPYQKNNINTHSELQRQCPRLCVYWHPHPLLFCLQRQRNPSLQDHLAFEQLKQQDKGATVNLMWFYGLNKTTDSLVPIGKIACGSKYYDQLLSLRHKFHVKSQVL